MVVDAGAIRCSSPCIPHHAWIYALFACLPLTGTNIHSKLKVTYLLTSRHATNPYQLCAHICMSRHIMSGSNIFCAGFTSEGVMWHASCHPSSYITHITKWNKDSCLHMRNNFGCSQQFWMFSCLYVVSCMRGCVLPYANVQAEGWTPKSKRSSLLFVYILALPSLMLTLALIFTSFVSIFLVHYYIVWQDCAPMSYCLYQPLFFCCCTCWCLFWRLP